MVLIQGGYDMLRAFSLMIACVAFAAANAAEFMSLADARGSIDVVIASPAAMTAAMKRLSPEDQQQFLGEVNTAIGKMPGSPERKAAKFVAINAAALRGSSKGNMANLLAEMYATASIESLTIINERFGSELFNRAASSEVTFTDEQFEKIAISVMKKVRERTATIDNSNVRNTLAALMFIRASNGSPADLPKKLVEGFDPKARETALNDWIPAAMGKSGDLAQTGDYETMLGEADAGARPNVGVVLRLYAPQMLDVMLVDLSNGIIDVKGASSFPVLDAGFGFGHDLDTVERMQNPGPESRGYQWQRL
jgi:hypothetical protein